jgi:hypothetical protein
MEYDQYSMTESQRKTSRVFIGGLQSHITESSPV